MWPRRCGPAKRKRSIWRSVRPPVPVSESPRAPTSPQSFRQAILVVKFGIDVDFFALQKLRKATADSHYVPNAVVDALLAVQPFEPLAHGGCYRLPACFARPFFPRLD